MLAYCCNTACSWLASDGSGTMGNIVWTGGLVLRLLAGGAAFGLLGGAVCCFAFECLTRRSDARHTDGAETDRREGNSRRKDPDFFRISLILIFLCWLPAYMAFYPGICAYDTTIQTGQIVGNAYNDHHPILHTLLIAGAMRLGEAVGNVNTGVGLLTFVQMLALAATYAGGITYLRRCGVHRGFWIALQLIAMFYPFHWYLSVSMCKDVPFTIFFVIEILAFTECVRRRDSRVQGCDLLFVCSAVLMQLFRTNGRYAMLVLQGILILCWIFGKKERYVWRKLTLLSLASLLIGSLGLSVLFRMTNAEQGDRREMLSMPIQQMARCMVYHSGAGVVSGDDGTMDETDKELINDFLLDEAWREYRPDIADPVKRHANTYVARYRSGDFIRTYLHLWAEYPGDMVNAALAVNAGYLYINDTSHAQINENGTDKGLGYVQTRWVDEELNPRGIYQASKWTWLKEKLEQWADENAYLQIPLLKYLFVPGVFLWAYLLRFCYLIYRGKYAICLPLALVLGYYLTLLLGPTVQLRYLYPLMAAFPFLTLMSDNGVRKGVKNEESIS